MVCYLFIERKPIGICSPPSCWLAQPCALHSIRQTTTHTHTTIYFHFFVSKVSFLPALCPASLCRNRCIFAWIMREAERKRLCFPLNKLECQTRQQTQGGKKMLIFFLFSLARLFLPAFYLFSGGEWQRVLSVSRHTFLPWLCYHTYTHTQAPPSSLRYTAHRKFFKSTNSLSMTE